MSDEKEEFPSASILKISIYLHVLKSAQDFRLVEPFIADMVEMD